MIRDPGFHRGGHPERLVNPRKVVEHEMQAKLTHYRYFLGFPHKIHLPSKMTHFFIRMDLPNDLLNNLLIIFQMIFQIIEI